MKEKISKTCLKYMRLKAEGRDKEARKLLEALPEKDFTTLYIASLEHFKFLLDRKDSPYLLATMAREYFKEHVGETLDSSPNDLSCRTIDGFIYYLMKSFEKQYDRKHQNPFAEELLNDSDPEVAAVGREILKGGC